MSLVCSWNVVGMKLVNSYVKFPRAPFARAPFWRMPREVPFSANHYSFDSKRRSNLITRDGKTHDSGPETRQVHPLISTAWKSGNFLHALGHVLTTLHKEAGEKGKHPLKKTQKKTPRGPES